MAVQLTDKEAWILGKLAYMNIGSTENEVKDEFKGETLQQIATDLLNKNPPREFCSYGGLTDKEQNALLGEIASGKYSNLSNLVLKDYANENTTTGSGFVGYAFSAGSPGGNPSDRFYSFRGSEGEPVGINSVWDIAIGKTGIDWIDNAYTTLKNVPLQFADAKGFVERNMVQGAQAFVTGHSKGAANAMYVAAVIQGVTGINPYLSTIERIKCFAGIKAKQYIVQKIWGL